LAGLSDRLLHEAAELALQAAFVFAVFVFAIDYLPKWF
jgi:hypothetical protein